VKRGIKYEIDALPMDESKPFNKGVEKTNLYSKTDNNIRKLEESRLRKIFPKEENPCKPLILFVILLLKVTKITPLSNGLA